MSLVRQLDAARLRGSRQTRQLARALIYMLWRSVADSAACTCHPRDVCPECKASKALGIGRWKGADAMMPKIMEAQRVLRRRSP